MANKRIKRIMEQRGITNIAGGDGMREEVNIIFREDDKVRIVYWSKTTGEISMIVSKKIARKLQRKLKEGSLW